MTTSLGSVRKVAVFRALVLGDLLCATPALRACKRAWPRSELTLIGLPWARALATRLPAVDRFVAFPGYPGLPEMAPELSALPGFLARMQADRYDLLLQMHGSGSVVNPLLACFDAKHVAGFSGTAEDEQWTAEPSLHRPWPESGREIERLLALTDHLGFERDGTTLDFPVHGTDREALALAVPELDIRQPFVCIHPGAQLPSRRWPPTRFAAVADRISRAGFRVVLTGTAGEAQVTALVRSSMQESALDLAGRTGLFQLGALIERAALLVCNDTGVSHIAAALRRPSVVVSSGGDVNRWAPVDTALHRVIWADLPCRPCGHRICPTAHECAHAVTADEVAIAALQALNHTTEIHA